MHNVPSATRKFSRSGRGEMPTAHSQTLSATGRVIGIFIDAADQPLVSFQRIFELLLQFSHVGTLSTRRPVDRFEPRPHQVELLTQHAGKRLWQPIDNGNPIISRFVRFRTGGRVCGRSWRCRDGRRWVCRDGCCWRRSGGHQQLSQVAKLTADVAEF